VCALRIFLPDFSSPRRGRGRRVENAAMPQSVSALLLCLLERFVRSGVQVKQKTESPMFMKWELFKRYLSRWIFNYKPRRFEFKFESE